MENVSLGNCGEGLEFMEGYSHIEKLQKNHGREGLEKRIVEINRELEEIICVFQEATENNKIALAKKELYLIEERCTIERLIRRKYSVRARLNNSADHVKECVGEVASDCCPEVVKVVIDGVECIVGMCVSKFKPKF